MTRIALIAILIPTLVYSTEAVSAPVLYRSQKASSNVSTPSNQEAPTTKELPTKKGAKTRDVSRKNTKLPEQKPQELIPLGREVFSKETFQKYVGTSFSDSDSDSAFKIETSSAPEQTPFKATLVGVNINAWLENPDMHKELIKAAEKFPVSRLLDNLVQNNPEFTFNNPQLTERILKMDIYSPYFGNVTNSPKLPPLFTQYHTAVAYTRNYNIYGASAGGLPYFGTPTEGADRRINLSVNKQQLREYAVRFPDTDIFLVATINITPNWLEESWDIRQENRQFADIFIYAFNRKGKLLGGSGVSQSFLKGGQFITLRQRVYSKYWQSAIPRVFYITPSFKIVNTAVPGSKRESPSNEIEISKRPYLNSAQRYILASIENLRETQQKPEVRLFNEAGDRTYKHVKPTNKTNSQQPSLARRRFILSVDNTNFMPVFNYPTNVLAELDGAASLPIVQIPVRANLQAPKVSSTNATPPSTSKARQPKEKASKTNDTVTNARAVITPTDVQPSQARQQGEAKLTNTNSQVLTPRTNLPATNQGAPRRAPSDAKALSYVGESESVDQQRVASIPLTSYPSSEYLVKGDMPSLLDTVSPLVIGEIELKAQNVATSATNQTPQRASITTFEEKNIPKSKKLSPAEQLQQTEDKIQQARENKFSKDQAKLKKAMSIRRYFPSNEADKLKEMLDIVAERLKEAPYFTTNDLQAVTNSIPPFELETDPAVYRSERKKYYSIPVSVSRFKKQFDKETRALKSARTARLNDELYWANLHRKMLIENNNWSPSLETQHVEFQKQHSLRKKMELTQLIYQRNGLFYQVISNEIQSYLDRSRKYAQQTLKLKKQPAAIAKLQKQSVTVLDKYTAKYQTPEYASKVTSFQEAYSNTSSNFTAVFNAYALQKPKDLPIAYQQQDNNSSKENSERLMGIARANKVPVQLVTFADSSKAKYPTKVYLTKMKNAARREYKRNMRFVVYEGYIFVLSGKWKVKTSLADRLDVL